MPALVFCNRRWRIGSDDFPLPGIVEILIRVGWLLLVAMLFIQHEQVSCSAGSTELRIYLIGVAILLVAVICVTVALVVTSAKGGVMDVQARCRVPTILSIRIAMAFPEVAWQLMGSIWIFTGRISCNDHAPLWVLLKALLVVTWCALFFVLFIIVLLFEPMLRPDYSGAPELPSTSVHPHGNTYTSHASMGSHYIQLWERRCRILCCASSKDETSLEALRNVADILASIFEDSELVASDIAAALVLLRMQQKYREKREKREMSRRRNRRQLERQEDMRRVESEVGVVASQDLRREAYNARATVVEGGDEKRDQAEQVNVYIGSEVEDSTQPVMLSGVDESTGLKLKLDIPSPTNSDSSSFVEPNDPTSANRSCPSPSGSNLVTSIGSELLSPVEDTPQFYVAPPSSCIASPPHPWMTVANAQHYMKFALASYGWPWYMYGRCFTTFGSMWPFLKFGASCCTRSAPESVYGDNCCLCHTAAMKAITGLDDEDFCLVYHLNNIYEVPFFVAVDHDTSSIIVAIRGTMSLKDTITDMTAQTAPVYGAHCSEPHCLAHKGMVHAADFVYDKLKQTQVLHRLLAKFPSYRLVVTGHSLGAGAAVVLTARLRKDCDKLRSYGTSASACTPATVCVENPDNLLSVSSTGRSTVLDEGTKSTDSAMVHNSLDHSRENNDVQMTASNQVVIEQVTVISAVPAVSVSAPMCTNTVFSTALSSPVDILCFAFSPPGGLCSEEFAKHTLEYVMSVVVGDDLVPRLSMHSLHNLRAQIVTVLEQSHQPKFRLLAQGCWFMLFGISETTLQKRFTDSSLYNGGNNVRGRRRKRRKVEAQIEGEDDAAHTTERVGLNSVDHGEQTAPNNSTVNLHTYNCKENSPTFCAKRKLRKSSHASSSRPANPYVADDVNEENNVSDGEDTAADDGDLEVGRSRRAGSCEVRRNRSQSITPNSSSSSQPLLTSTAGRLQNYESLENVRRPAPAARDASQPTCAVVHSPRHTETTLCLPGHVLHVRPSSIDTPGRWKVQWSPPCQFTSLVISPNMMRHHLPQEVMKAMDFILEHNMIPERS